MEIDIHRKIEIEVKYTIEKCKKLASREQVDANCVIDEFQRELRRQAINDMRYYVSKR